QRQLSWCPPSRQRLPVRSSHNGPTGRSGCSRLVFGLQLFANEPVHTIALRTRIVIDARRRRYTAEQQRTLSTLFGESTQWHSGMRAVQRADVATMVPGFAGDVTVGLWVPCTHDVDVAAAKYFDGVDGADVPVAFHFSGTAFVRGPAGIAVVRLSHELTTSWSMPAPTWRDLMEVHFPGFRWVRL